MEPQILDLMTTYGGQGIFFLLFLFLFKKQFEQATELKKEYKDREDKLYTRLEQNQASLNKNQEILSEAVDSLKVLETIKEKIDEIHKRP
jgi:predicted Holliday junction resolvase-like endonuclease